MGKKIFSILCKKKIVYFNLCMFIALFVYVYRQVLPAVSAVSLIDMKHIADTYEIIGIDEGQFVSTLPEVFFVVVGHYFFYF